MNLKIKSVRIKCFLKISKTKNSTNLFFYKSKKQIYKVQIGSHKYKKDN